MKVADANLAKTEDQFSLREMNFKFSENDVVQLQKRSSLEGCLIRCKALIF